MQKSWSKTIALIDCDDMPIWYSKKLARIFIISVGFSGLPQETTTIEAIQPSGKRKLLAQAQNA
jgi:hypothetical protein